mgnify:CR=1 FL=1
MTHSTHLAGLTLNNLIGVLPVDFMVIVKSGNIEVLKGITWVVPYKSQYCLYKDRNVASFHTDFYNTEIVINIKN